ncbi:redoxin domain-containing protein, partial [bacterium]|nr:redoxin domain-containing protein [bacterium]
MHSIRLQVRTLLLSLFYLTVPAFVVAGEYNPELSPGDPAPAMASLEGTDGKSYSLDSFKQAEVIVIAFTCNTCPYAIDYEKRLSQLAREYADDDRVAFLAINSNREPADSLEEMRKRVEEQKLPYP